MKTLFLKAICCSLAICCILSMAGFYGACEEIEEEVFRLHIMANSDSKEDQELKIKVRDSLLEYMGKKFVDCNSKNEAAAYASEHIEEIGDYTQKLVKRYGSNHTVRAYVTRMHFSTRVYENYTLPAGEYDALRIEIGSGKGHNWWCVLYPGICIPSASKVGFEGVLNDNERDIVEDSSNYQVRFKIVELFEEFVSLFR